MAKECWRGARFGALAMVFCSLEVVAQVRDVRCERLAMDEGLSQLSVTTSLQDASGFLWFGTQAGLNRYDGYTFRVFKRDFNDPGSLPDNYIQDLLPDADGSIWIATLSGGLSRFDPRTERFTTIRHQPEGGGLSHARLSSLARDHDGRIWVGTWGGGLNRYDPFSGEIEVWQSDPEGQGTLGDDGVRRLLLDDEGRLWVGTNGGLFSFDDASGRFTEHVLSSDRLSQPVVMSLAMDGEGAVWAGTESSGLFRLGLDGEVTRFSREDFDPTTLAHDQVESLFVDRRGDLWVGTSDGLSLFDKDTDQFQSFRHDPLDIGSLPADRISSVLQDRSGLLWFGTWTGGLCKLNTSITSFTNYRHQQENPRSLADNRVRDFLETADGQIWVAMLGGGIARFDPEQETFQSFRHDPFYPNSIASDDIHALAQDAEGYIWVGSRNAGLDRFDPRTGTAIRFGGANGGVGLLDSDHVLDLMVDDRQRLWIGTWDGGLARLDIATGTVRKYRYDPDRHEGLSSDSIGVLFQSRSGEIWIGTRDAGLMRYQPDSDSFIAFRPEPERQDGLLHGVITSITQDPSGDLWITTQGGGFAKVILDGSGQQASFRGFTHSQGLAGDALGTGVFDGSGRYWVSSLVGVSRFDPRDGSIANFYSVHGVQRSGFYVGSGFGASSGEIYFGGIDGFTRFTPVEFPIDTTPPQVVITDLLVNNRRALPGWRDPGSPLENTIQFTERVTLTHTQPIFSFEFSGLHYVEPSKNRYYFMLEGFDSDWVETNAQRRYATYTNLDPGDYRFRVRAANRDGVLSREEAQVAVSIRPPPWLTPWAYLGYAVLFGLVAGGIGFQRYRVAFAEREAQRVIRESEEQLKLALWGSGDEFWILDVRDQRFRRMRSEENKPREEKHPVNKLEDFWKLMHPDDVQAVQQAMDDHLKGRVPYFEAQFRILGSDDQWIWALSRGRVKEHDTEGRPVTISGATKDITPLKQTEEALRELNEKLESIVEARTQDLQSANHSLRETLDKLRQTQDQLVEAEKMASLGGLVAGVAHEINTPLGVAVTAASHLEKEVRKLVNMIEQPDMDLDSARDHINQQLQNTQFVLKNLRRAADLVRSFKQVAVDQSTEDQRQFNLNEYLHEILVSLRPRFKRTQHVVHIECPETLVLNSYPGAIYQVITNLVMNSLVHGFEEISKGHIDIRVQAEGDRVVIHYRDDGGGFGPDIERRIFEPFFTTKRSKGGSGLGMHIVFNLVTQVLGGTITCQGNPGEGVEFVIVMPARVSKESVA